MFYEDVLRALNVAGVRYVLVGGTAVILHGVPRTTADLDMVVDLERENVLRLVSTLTNLGFRPRAPVPASDLADAAKRREWQEDKGLKAFSFHRPERPLDAVDILIDSPLNFAHLDKNAEHLLAGDLDLRIAGVSDLIRMKRAAGRAQDEADIDALERLQEAER